MTLILVIFLIHSGNGSISSDEDDVVPPSLYERGTSRSGGANPSEDTGVDVDGAFSSTGTRGTRFDTGKEVLDSGEFLMGSNDNVELPYKWTVVTYPDNGSGRTKSLFLILHCLSGTTDGCLKVQISKDDLSTITIEHGTGQVETLWYRNSGLYDDCIPSVQEQFSLVDSSLTENYNNVPKQVQSIIFPFQLRHIIKVDMSSQPFVVNHHGFEQEEIFTTAIIEAKIAWDDMDRIKTSTVRRKAAILSPRAQYMDGIGRVATTAHTGDESAQKPYTNIASSNCSNAGMRQETNQEDIKMDSHDALGKILEEKIAEAVAKLQLADRRTQPSSPVGNLELESNEAPEGVTTLTSKQAAKRASSASTSTKKKPMMRIKTPSSRTSATAEESEDEYNGKIVSFCKGKNSGTDDEDISYAAEE